MSNLLSNKLIQLIMVSIVTLVVGVAIGTLTSSSGGDSEVEDLTSTPREMVLLSSGEGLKDRAEPGTAGFSQKIALGEANDILLPITATVAITAGWIDSGQCIAGLGRYFKGDNLPFALIYNKADDLIGIYHFSSTELPSPFVKLPAVPEAGIDTDHWGLYEYFVDQDNAC